MSNVQLSAIVDAFNVFNLFDKDWAMAVTQVDQEWSWGVYYEDPDPGRQTNDNYGNPIAYQSPWSVRLGLKLSW